MKFILPLEIKEIKKVVPHAIVLEKVLEILPGKSGMGTVCFKKEKLHFLNNPRVRASLLIQAALELAEFVRKSIPGTKEKEFLGAKYEFTTRKEGVSPLKIVYFKVEIGAHGTAMVTGDNDKNCVEPAFQGKVIFLLKKMSNKGVSV
ncbi:MAG: hypothetical protein PHG83_01285 [Patescibacteria group bacterium]|nr:hypothetical protein [Patescibacteria group bacterium]